MDPVRFQEAVDFVAGFKAEEPPPIGLVEMTRPVLLGRQGLQRPAREIVARVTHSAGDIVGDLHGHFRAPPASCPRAGSTVISPASYGT